MNNPIQTTANFITNKYTQEHKNLKITQEYIQNYIK